ncbi:MAG: di-heme oxidoredictase family protein [Planctomycetota bacterium]
MVVAVAWVALVAAAVAVGCEARDVPTSRYGLLAGGDATVFVAGSGAYEQPVPGLDPATQAAHDAGDTMFSTVPAGRGPLFNEPGCDSCHFRAGRSFAGLGLLRVSVPGVDAGGGPLPAADFGLQLQTRATSGVTREGDVTITHEDVAGQYGDGTAFTLQRVVASIDNPYVALPGTLLQSLRAAPPVFGQGLLEALDDATILAAADEADTNSDGISGRANMVRDAVSAELRVGRFGWKAEQPDLRQQIASALHEDIGTTTSLFPAEACAGQTQDDGLADDPELADLQLEQLLQYIRTLAVPARRNPDDAITLRGEQLFLDAGCASCHTPTLVTGNTHPVVALRDQTIHPFTDLLLHDMGDELADDRQVFVATGNEWRTPPLWGLGLRNVVNPDTRLLHDGRARTTAEAILWHGGESLAAREAFRNLPADDRHALLQFVESN